MAETSLSTPGMISRRFLFSVAAAAPIAAAAAGSSPTSAPRGLFALLDRYRDTGMRLHEVEATHATTLQHIPAGFRPGPSTGQALARWPEWTRAELDALQLPPVMPLRPSRADFDRVYRQSVRRSPENREELKRRHKIRLDAWHDRRNIQKEWYSRTGLDAINRQRTRLLADKHRIERELMELMISPDKAAIDA
jgi:hypothetical protein